MLSVFQKGCGQGIASSDDGPVTSSEDGAFPVKSGGFYREVMNDKSSPTSLRSAARQPDPHVAKVRCNGFRCLAYRDRGESGGISIRAKLWT